MGLSGLAQLNIEVNSTCDKRNYCSFCSHQKPEINTAWQPGEMDFSLLQSIRAQVEPGITISWHRDGDPLAYSKLGDALKLFEGFTTSIVTHGLNLGRRAADVIENVTTVTCSIFRGDPDRDLQLASLRTFLIKKGDKAPVTQLKIVGDLSQEELAPYEELGVRIVRRLIHIPIGNSKYAHRSPTVPEVGICLDALHRPTIDWQGNVYLCNRLDVQQSLLLGNIREHTLESIWNGPTRQRMLNHHKAGRRDLANPLCAKCTFWGIASD